MGKVSQMVDYKTDSFLWSREQAIEAFKEYLKKNPQIKKVLLICVDTTNNHFVVNWSKAQMTNSEALAALDMAHYDIAKLGA